MSPEDLRVLADRATAVEGRPTTRLAEVHARIRTTRRRRQVGAVVATVVAVVLALTAGTAVVKLTETAPPPASPPSPTPTPKVDDKDASAGRRLVYVRGSTIHLGDQTIDAGGEVEGVAATDDGAVFTRASGEQRDNCNQVGGCFSGLWFTDGADILRIGRVAGTWVRGYRVDVSSAGSTVLWFEPAADTNVGGNYGERGTYVAYDTGERREVARFGSDGRDPDHNGHDHLAIQAVFDDYVYWTPDDRAKEWCVDYSKYYEACRRNTSVMRLDTATGTQAKVPWSAYIVDRKSRPHLFLGPTDKPDAPDNPFPYNRPGAEAITFGRQGDRLVAQDGGGAVVAARLAPSGEPLRLRLPAGYHDDVEAFFFQMWLDDDRFALLADNREDVLSCRLSTGRCRVVVRGPVDYSFNGHG